MSDSGLTDKVYISTIASDAAETAAEYGLGLEIAEYCTAMNMDLLFDSMSAQVDEKIKGIKKLVFHGPFNELFPCAIDPKARELAAYRFNQAIALAESCGACKIIFHGAFSPYLYFPVWYVDESIKFWKEFMKGVPEKLTICLENVLEPEPEMLKNIAEGVGHDRLKLCLDIGHVNAYSKIDVMQWLRVQGSWIDHFHVHNNYGDYDSHNPIMEGNIDIDDFFRASKEFCPKASYTLELLDSQSSAVYMKKTGLLS